MKLEHVVYVYHKPKYRMTLKNGKPNIIAIKKKKGLLHLFAMTLKLNRQ